MVLQPITKPAKDVILYASGFPSVLHRVLWGPGAAGNKGAKGGYSLLSLSRLFLFSFFFPFYFFAYHISSWSFVWKKNPLCSNESLKTIDLDQISLFSMSTSGDPLTDVFWNSDRLSWPLLTSTPAILPSKQIILANPHWVLVIHSFFFLILKICLLKKASYTRLQWALRPYLPNHRISEIIVYPTKPSKWLVMVYKYNFQVISVC